MLCLYSKQNTYTHLNISRKRNEKNKVLNTVTMTVNYFHPVYRSKRLNKALHQEVESYIFNELDAVGLESCRKFTKDKDLFESMKQKKNHLNKYILALRSRYGPCEVRN